MWGGYKCKVNLINVKQILKIKEHIEIWCNDFGGGQVILNMMQNSQYMKDNIDRLSALK